MISKIGERRPQSDAALVCVYGQTMGRMYPLCRGETLIGRSSQAGIQIDHESVSRRHARLHLEENHAILADCGSTNGSYVNDEAVQEQTLQHGDLIKIGRTILKYLANDNIEAAYHEEIFRLSTVDGLTRCFNRRYFQDQLVREVSRAVRYGRPLSLLLFDIDDFGKINDEFGHLAGDAVLTQMGKRLGRRLRREDTLARWDDGQFALLLPEVDGAAATLLAERIRGLLCESSFGFDDVDIPVNISMAVVGLGNLDLEMDTAEVPNNGNTDEFPLFHEQSFSELEARVEDPQGDRFVGLSESLFRMARTRLTDIRAPAMSELAL